MRGFLLLLPFIAIAFSDEESSAKLNSKCPEEPGVLHIAGTKSIQALTKAWKDPYLNQRTDDCELGIEIEGYGSNTAAARVCAIHPIYEDVEIAGMQRPFFQPQASTKNGWSFDCKFSSERNTILVSVL